MAEPTDYIGAGDDRRAALERVAFKHGMSVDEWQAYAAGREAHAKERRQFEQSMRQVPRYRDAA